VLKSQYLLAKFNKGNRWEWVCIPEIVALDTKGVNKYNNFKRKKVCGLKLFLDE
jgi:hypothetical protein